MAGNVPGDWSLTDLGEIVDQIAGFAFKSEHYTVAGDGVPLLRGDNIGLGTLRWDGHRSYPEALLEGLDRYAVQAGDIVIAMDRPWIDAGLKVARVLARDMPALLVQRVTRLRAGSGVDPDFLWACVRSPRFVAHLRSETTGTAVPHISGKQIASFPVWLPPLTEQRAVASVLGALDDMIESNRRLSHAARDVLLLAPPHSGDCTPLDSLATFRNGGALTKNATGRGRPILRIKELKAGVTNATPRTDHDVRSEHEVTPGDLLFSWSGTLLTHRWSGEDSVLNQHVFRVDPIDGVPRWFAEAWIERHLPEFRAIAADKATTMGHIQRRHLAEAEVTVPGEDEMRALSSTYDAVDAQRIVALRESRTLTAIRDALLPELVSGRIRVPLSDDPDEQSGAATDSLKAAGSDPGRLDNQSKADPGNGVAST